jgi:hypothetical protein
MDTLIINMKKLISLILVFMTLNLYAGEGINLHLDMAKQKYETGTVSTGPVLMLGGVIFLGAAILTPGETEWTYGKETPYHKNNNVKAKPYTDAPIWRQPSKLLPGVTGVCLLVPGIAITIGDKR